MKYTSKQYVILLIYTAEEVIVVYNSICRSSWPSFLAVSGHFHA
jgi:hypothetical protein